MIRVGFIAALLGTFFVLAYLALDDGLHQWLCAAALLLLPAGYYLMWWPVVEGIEEVREGLIAGTLGALFGGLS